MKTVQELATHYLTFFVTKERDNKETFLCTVDESPNDLVRLIQSAHDGLMPDDYKYKYVHDALLLISENDDASRDNITDRINEIESDIYTHDLLKWLSSNLTRTNYVDEATKEYGHSTQMGVVGDISMGQYMEKVAVAYQVLHGLETILETMVA